MNEIWKDVVGFEGIYKISNIGEVKSLERDCYYGNRICHRKEKILSKHFSSDKYYMVKLCDNKNHNIHQLVANAFIPKPNTNEKLEVDHINGIRTDNRPENLRWITHADNIRHAYELGNGHMGGTKDLNYNAKEIEIIHKYTNQKYKFKCIQDCALFLKQYYNINTKISSIYDSLRKHNINKNTYRDFYVKY